MVIGLALLGIIGGAGGIATMQLIKGTETSNNHDIVNNELNDVAQWMSEDVQSSWPFRIEAGDDPATATRYEIIRLGWDEWATETEHSISYYFENSSGVQELHRRHVTGITEDIVIARHIDYDSLDDSKTSCDWDYGLGVATITITGQYGSGVEMATETRQFEVTPRVHQ